MEGTGIICRVVAARGFGFIQQDNGGDDLFFHATQLADDLAFDEQLLERRVRFDTIESDKGQRAVDVRAAE